MKRDLADPDFEPSDADLAELLHRAGEGVRESRRALDAELRARVAAERERTRIELAARTRPAG